MFSVSVKANERVKIIVTNVRDAHGLPAPLDSPPQFFSADPSVLTATSDTTDPMSGWLTPTGAGTIPAQIPVQVKADARLGEGVHELVEDGMVEIQPAGAGEATTMTVMVVGVEPQQAA